MFLSHPRADTWQKSIAIMCSGLVESWWRRTTPSLVHYGKEHTLHTLLAISSASLVNLHPSSAGLCIFLLFGILGEKGGGNILWNEFLLSHFSLSLSLSLSSICCRLCPASVEHNMRTGMHSMTARSCLLTCWMVCMKT